MYLFNIYFDDDIKIFGLRNRTQYPPDMLDLLMPAMKSKCLPPLDRLGVLDDLFSMVRTLWVVSGL